MYVSYLSYSATNTCIRKNEMHTVFWIVTSLSLVGGYQCFGGTLVYKTTVLSRKDDEASGGQNCSTFTILPVT
jgi:hypothetical protein